MPWITFSGSERITAYGLTRDNVIWKKNVCLSSLCHWPEGAWETGKLGCDLRKGLWGACRAQGWQVPAGCSALRAADLSWQRGMLSPNLKSGIWVRSTKPRVDKEINWLVALINYLNLWATVQRRRLWWQQLSILQPVLIAESGVTFVFFFPSIPILFGIQLQLGNFLSGRNPWWNYRMLEQWEMWRRDPGTSWRRTAIGRVWMLEFSEMKAEKGKTRTGCHRYIRSLNAGDKGELFNWSTMLAQEQLGTGCPWIHLDNVNRWKTAIQK